MRTGPGNTGNSLEDEFLCQLYQQITELQVARFGAGYDIAAGAGRFKAWLGERTVKDQATLEAMHATRSGPQQAAHGGTGAAALADAAAATSASMTGQGSGIHDEILPGWVERDAGRAVTALYDEHYPSLVRLAVLLVSDVATAEEVVQDSFVALHVSWRRLRGNNAALSYLRKSVVNRSRSVLRHRIVADQNPPQAAWAVPSAEQQAIAALEDSAVISALRALPARQREVLIMAHYAGLSEAQIAEVMGISEGAVKHHAARALASLRTALDLEPGDTHPGAIDKKAGSALPPPSPGTIPRPGTCND